MNCAAANHQEVSIVIHIFLEPSSLEEQIKSNKQELHEAWGNASPSETHRSG